MATAVETKRRKARKARLILAFQTAKGTLVDDFTTVDAATFWVEEVSVDVGHRKSEPTQWMTESLGDETGARYSMPEKPVGTILARATAESLEWLLRSNFGPLVAGTFTLKSQIDKFLTLAWVEDGLAGATDKLVRIPDVWIHTLTIQMERETGLINLVAEYAGRGDIQVHDLDALPGGVVLPAAPMKPTDKEFMRVRRGSWVRDPLGANVELRFSSLSIVLAQGLRHEWSMMENLTDVSKTGKTRARINFTGNVSDETWAIIDNARANTKERFRVVAVTEAPVKTLTLDFFEMDFDVDPIGKVGFDYVNFQAAGQAHVGPGGFVTVSLA